MGKKLHLDMAAEREANDIGRKFMNSTDVVGDMSRAYGADLSAVKIHTDSAAAGMAEQRGVDAFSTGKDVFFGRGIFDKNDPASRGLLAHELSHSLQQGVGGSMGGMQQSAPVGAEQGGLISWFRDRKRKKAEQARLQELYEGILGQNLPDKVRSMRNLSITNTYLNSDMDGGEKGVYRALIQELGALPAEEKQAFVDEMFRQQLDHAGAVNEVAGEYEDSAQGDYMAGYSDDAAMMQGYSSLITDFNLLGNDDSGEFFMEAYGDKLRNLMGTDQASYQALRAAQSSAQNVGDGNTWAQANAEEAERVRTASRARGQMFARNWKRPGTAARRRWFRR